MSMEHSGNLSLSQALQAAIKEWVRTEQAESGNHCLRCALTKAHDHMEAVQETTLTMLEMTSHSHRTRGDRAKGKVAP